jgi:hypothetical protein
MSVESSPANRIRGILVTRAIPGQGGLWLFGCSQPSLPPHPPKTTMFSRLSASKAALKSVGTAGRTLPPQSTVRAQTNLGSPSNPHLSISPGPVPLVQRWSSSRPGPYFLLFLSSLTSEPVSSALTRLTYRVGLRQHTHCWFDCLVHPPLWVASVRRPSSRQLSRRRWTTSYRLSMVTQRIVRHVRSCQVPFFPTFVPLPF